MSALDVRLAQQRELARLYEDRVGTADSDASGIATAAVAMGALLVAAASKFDPNSGLSLAYTVAAGGLLVLTVAVSIVARMFRAAELQPAIESAETAFASLPASADEPTVINAAIAIWTGHAARAKVLSGRKRRFVRGAAFALYAASGCLGALGLAQL